MNPPIRALIYLLAIFLVLGCDRIRVPPSAPEQSLPSEPWAAQPPAEWPQLVLTNAATFRGHSTLRGASSFLVRGSNGHVVAATALHLIGEAGGVEPTIPSERLDAVLSSWRMFPRTQPGNAVTVAKLASSSTPPRNLDWLLLSIANHAGPLPSTPLALRASPVEIGEEVFLVGVPYAEPDRMQNVYRCRVTARGFQDRFRYSVEPPVDIRGFSGSPIVDRHGLVVGIMTVWFEPKMQGEKFLEAGGEDAAAIIRLVEEQH